MKNPIGDLIYMFFMIIFLLVVVYISSFAYQKKYLPVRLSKFEYSTYKSHQNLPEDIDSLTYAQNLNQCPPGQCAIDIKTGFKRCPSTKRGKLVYNFIEEKCTRLQFCDYKKLPYAVRSDGSATSSICENGTNGELIACRCTDKKTCSTYQLSKFSIVEKKSKTTGERNFSIFQEPGVDQGDIAYSSLTLDNPTQEFCQINPGFTSILQGGCNLTNSLEDRLGCERISTIVLGEIGQSQLTWQFSKDITIGDTSAVLTSKDSKYLTLPESGILLISSAATDKGSSAQSETETVQYKIGTSVGVTTLGGESDATTFSIPIQSVTSISLTKPNETLPQGTPFSPGFQFAWDKTANLTLVDATVEYCTAPAAEPNYKNMLICTQSNNSICKYGEFTYNFDKLRGIKDTNILPTDVNFSRNFCQFNLANNVNINNDDYLRDPEFYTLSCGIGSGCDGKNLGDKPEENARGKYFPDVDINGINGIWNVTAEKFPKIDFSASGQGLDASAILLNNNTIQPGDFWSIQVINDNILSSGISFQVNDKEIEVENLYGLEIYVNSPIPTDDPKTIPLVNIAGTSYQLTHANFTYDTVKQTNKSSICITPGLTALLPPYSDIRISPPNLTSDQTYGIISKDTDGTYTARTVNGASITAFKDLKLDITIYKQFAFSGPNYCTKVSTYSGNTSFASTSNRIYTQGNESQLTYVVSSPFPNPGKYPLTPPENIYQLSYSSKNRVQTLNVNYYSPQAPFKIPMSMYYPVWNPVLFQQECVRCKPFLLATPELNSVRQVQNIIIQFCGKDFKNYEYNARDDNYCYVSTSKLGFDVTGGLEINSERIILEEPNFFVEKGDYVLDSSLQMPFDIKSTIGVNTSNSYSYLSVVPQIFPRGWKDDSSNKTIYQSNITNLHSSQDGSGVSYPSLGIEESTSENFYIEETDEFLKSNLRASVKYESITKKWNLIDTSGGTSPPNNYFFGKKYEDASSYNTKASQLPPTLTFNEGFYFVPTRKVIDISEDRRTILVNSPYPYKIKEDPKGKPIYVQFCRLDSPLKINLTNQGGTPYTGTSIKVSAISDSRITNIGIISNNDKFLPENLPLVKIDNKNQNFL